MKQIIAYQSHTQKLFAKQSDAMADDYIREFNAIFDEIMIANGFNSTCMDTFKHIIRVHFFQKTNTGTYRNPFKFAKHLRKMQSYLIAIAAQQAIEEE